MRQWSPSDVSTVIRTLGECDAGKIRTQGVELLSAALGEPCSYDLLKHRLASMGLSTPSKWCKGKSIDLEVDLTDLNVEPEPITERAPNVSPMAQSVNVSNVERVALIPDCHVPNEDPIAFALALKAIQVFRCDTLVILGDFAEFESVSSHARRPDRLQSFKAEVDAVNLALDRVDAISCTRKIYTHGNHEARAKRFVNTRAPELYGLIDVNDLFGLKRRGYEIVEYGSWAEVGKLVVCHDIDHAGATAAQRSRDELNKSCAIGHCHNANISYRGDIYGDSHVGMSCGWLGSKNSIDYIKKPKVARAWQHGFGIAYVERDTGNCHVHFVPIVNGRACVEGRIIEADRSAA